MLKKMFLTHSGYQTWHFHMHIGEKIVFSVKGVTILFIMKGRGRFNDFCKVEASEEEIFFISEPNRSCTLYSLDETEVLIVQFPEVSVLYYYLFSDIAFIKKESINFFYSLPMKKAIKNWTNSMVIYINNYCIDPYLMEIKISELLIVIKALSLYEDILLFFSLVKEENQLV